MKQFFDAFSELFLKLIGICLLVIPIYFLLNRYSGWDIRLKIGHGSGIELPQDWQGLVAVEVLLGIIFLISLGVHKLSQNRTVSVDKTFCKDWPLRAVSSCLWDISTYSINGLSIKMPLENLSEIFGVPKNVTEFKLCYPHLGLDILYAAKSKTVAGFKIHFVDEDGYKPCPLKAKLNDGSWQNFSRHDNQQTMRTMLGTPTETQSLKDGFSETFIWENAKIQIFYTTNTHMRFLIFALK